MIPDLPPNPRAEQEARITAWLLGELSADEAARVREQIEQDPELARLRERLAQTLNLLRETVATPIGETPASPAPLKLSPARREKLLAHFKTIQPEEFARPKRPHVSLLTVLAAAASIIIVAALLMPALSSSKSKSTRGVILSNLRQLEIAKRNWAEDQHKPAGAVPTMDDLKPYVGDGGKVPSVHGETYFLGAVGQPPVAQLNDKVITLNGSLPQPNMGAGAVAESTIKPPATFGLTGRAPITPGNGSAQTSNSFVGQYAWQPTDSAGADKNTLEALRERRLAENGPAGNTSAGKIVLPQSNESELAEAAASKESPVINGNAGEITAGLDSLNGQNRNLQPPPAPSPVALPAQAPNGIAEDRSQLGVDYATTTDSIAAKSTPDISGLNTHGLGGNAGPVVGGRFYLQQEITNSGAVASTQADIERLFGPGAKGLSQSVDTGKSVTLDWRSGTVWGPVEGSKAVQASNSTGTPLTSAPGKQGQFVLKPASQYSKNANTGVQGGTARAIAASDGSLDETFNAGVQSQAVNKDSKKLQSQGGTLFTPPWVGTLAAPVAASAPPPEQPASPQAQRAPAHGAEAMVRKEFEPSEQPGFKFGFRHQPTYETPIPGQTTPSEPGGVNFRTRPGDAEKTAAAEASAGPEPVKPKEIPLKYARASDVAAVLQALGASGGAAVGRASSASNFEYGDGVVTANPNVESVTRAKTEARAAFEQNLRNLKKNAAGKPAPSAAPSSVESVNAVGYINVPVNTNVVVQLSLLDRSKTDQESERLRALPAPENPADQIDKPLPRPVLPAPIPQPEVQTRVNAFTTFSLNISDVAFKLAQASLQNGQMPEAASMRSEEFINAFDYRDPEPAPGAPIGFAWDRAGDPFTHNRDFVRFAIRTAAQGREAGRPLNLVLLLDKSGSMERADRVAIIARALDVLASQLHPDDTLSVVIFARTARLFVDGVPGNQAGGIAKQLRALTPEGGTNLEEAMRLAYEAALRHYLANGENRVVLMTDGAANLGNVDPAALKRSVESNRKQGIAFDCFGVGWDGYNDNLLETLSRAGNGRYGFVNTPEEAATEFAGKLAGALRVAAADVKVQVEFNPERVTAYRQIGYAKDQLKKEDFRNNNVKAAQIGAAESGNALYTVQINPAGAGPLGTVHVRYRIPGTEDYQEHEWVLPYIGGAIPLDHASPAMRLAATSAAFAEWLAGSPYATDVTPDRLLTYLRGVPQVYGADSRPAKLEWMIRQAKSISGK
jgi:Mg-chelatase subunit ChlD